MNSSRPNVAMVHQHFGVLESGEEDVAAKSFGINVDGCSGLIFQENPHAVLGPFK